LGWAIYEKLETDDEAGIASAEARKKTARE
jgi:hypothetical protein